MGAVTDISWADATWNPLRGCSRLSSGCLNCYAERIASRFSGPGQPYVDVIREVSGDGSRWNGNVALVRNYREVLRWRKSKTIFVGSMSDLFHAEVPVEVLDEIFAIMAVSLQHQFLLLTKRSGRMHGYLNDRGVADRVLRLAMDIRLGRSIPLVRDGLQWPLPNVGVGVSLESMEHFYRVVDLLDSPAAYRTLSLEPLLGPIDLREIGYMRGNALFVGDEGGIEYVGSRRGMIGMVFVGGESGAGARPAHPDWVRSLRRQCEDAGVAFHFKQWGEWGPTKSGLSSKWAIGPTGLVDRSEFDPFAAGHPGWSLIDRLGVRGTGARLDGVVYQPMPRWWFDGGGMQHVKS